MFSGLSSKALFQPNGLAGLLVSLGIAAIYICFGFPSGFIAGASGYWQAETQDVAQYIAGFAAFFQQPWQWPLLQLPSLNWPQGTIATFLDVIPLYALLLKALVPTEVGAFNPYGYWVGLCLLLQSLGGWWVLREAKANQWATLLALTVLLITIPVLQQRMGHISLLSQWILVVALALYVRGLRLKRSAGLGWCVLLLASLYINIYLTAMAALIYAADLWLHRGQPNWARWAAWPVCTALLAMASLLLMALPLPHPLVQEGGFGLLSMNMLGPLSGSSWFNLPEANPYQAVEGYSYLGAGAWLLLITAALCCLYKTTTAPDTAPAANAPRLLNGPMLFVMVLATLYALSQQITFGPFVVASWPVPEWALGLTGQFRASGRFFWLVAYVLTIASAITISRRFKGVALWLVFGVAVTIQVADRWPALKHLHGLTSTPEMMVLNKAAWRMALGNDVHTIYFYPKMRCGKISNFYDTLLPVMRFAAENKMNLNTGYIARYAPACGTEASEIAASDPARSAYVFVNTEYAPETVTQLLPAHRLQCRTVDFATVCAMH